MRSNSSTLKGYQTPCLPLGRRSRPRRAPRYDQSQWKSPSPSSKPIDKGEPIGPSTQGSNQNNINFKVDVDQEYLDFLGQSDALLRKWIGLFLARDTITSSNDDFPNFLNDLISSGVLKSDDMLVKFVRTVVQLCVNPTFNGLNNPEPMLRRRFVYETVDAGARLVALLIRRIAEAGGPELAAKLLQQFLAIVAATVMRDHAVEGTYFDPLAFHRFIIMFFQDMSVQDPVLEGFAHEMMSVFTCTLHTLRPAKVPGFAFVWLEIIGNRKVLVRMVKECSDLYGMLLQELIKFLYPFLRNADLAPSVHHLYRGMLRLFVLLLHDFPDFLSDYNYQFLDVIPPNCIQLRNVVLSAFPKTMVVPDPFSLDLNVDSMKPDIETPPKLLYNIGQKVAPLKWAVDEYLKHRGPSSFLTQLLMSLRAPKFDVGNRYNMPLMNALVLYVGSVQMVLLRNLLLPVAISTISHSAHMDIFETLAEGLDPEGRYVFLNALANQLRFPSSHTYYFNRVVLHLFLGSNNVAVKEQITRVLLERLVVYRPHAWGLLVTVAELMRNPIYNFWNYEFVQCFPFVTGVFRSFQTAMVSPTPLALLETDKPEANAQEDELEEHSDDSSEQWEDFVEDGSERSF